MFNQFIGSKVENASSWRKDKSRFKKIIKRKDQNQCKEHIGYFFHAKKNLESPVSLIT
jgi:hypothetical protein